MKRSSNQNRAHNFMPSNEIANEFAIKHAQNNIGHSWAEQGLSFVVNLLCYLKCHGYIKMRVDVWTATLQETYWSFEIKKTFLFSMVLTNFHLRCIQKNCVYVIRCCYEKKAIHISGHRAQWWCLTSVTLDRSKLQTHCWPFRNDWIDFIEPY